MRQPQSFSHARILQWMFFSCHRILVDTHIMSCLFSLFNHTQFRWLSSILFHYENIFWFLCHRLMLGSIFYNYRISYARQTKQCLAYKLPQIRNACQCEGNKKVGAIHVLFIFGQFKRVYPNYESQASRTGLNCTPECIELSSVILHVQLWTFGKNTLRFYLLTLFCTEDQLYVTCSGVRIERLFRSW